VASTGRFFSALTLVVVFNFCFHCSSLKDITVLRKKPVPEIKLQIVAGSNPYLRTFSIVAVKNAVPVVACRILFIIKE